MGKYRTFLQLHSLWFIIANLGIVALFIASQSGSMTVIIRIVSYPVIFLLNQPFTSRYNYYFRNIGVHPTWLFIRICALDLLLFLLFIGAYKLLS